MHYNPYLYEKLAQAHRQELLREAEQHRLLAHLSPRTPGVIDSVVSRLRALLMRPVPAKPAELHVRTATGKL